MWYASYVPETLPDSAIEDADASVVFALLVRRRHRRRTSRTSNQRQADIELALARLKEAMAPLKSEIGRFPYGPSTAIAEANREAIREASQAIQRERRKLFKMKNNEPN